MTSRWKSNRRPPARGDVVGSGGRVASERAAKLLSERRAAWATSRLRRGRDPHRTRTTASATLALRGGSTSLAGALTWRDMKLIRLAEINRRQSKDHPPSVAPEATVMALITDGAYDLDRDDLDALAKAQALLNTLPDPHASTARILDYLNQGSFVRTHPATDQAREIGEDIKQMREQLYDRLSKDEQRVCVAVAAALEVPAEP